MSFSKFLGSFVQATFFGGTYEDLSFELRVLKNELQALHDRLDKEFDSLADRLDKLEGKPGKGKGRSRLAIVGAAEIADIPSEPKLEAAPADSDGLQAVTPSSPDAGFLADMTIREAWKAHPEAPAVFEKHHLTGCIDCAMSGRETIAAGAGDHGLDVDALLADLNQLASN